MPAIRAVELSISRTLWSVVSDVDCIGCGPNCGWWLMPIFITVLAFGSLVKTPARSHAIWISASVRPLERRNFCFCTMELRVTFGFCRKEIAVLILKKRVLDTVQKYIYIAWEMYQFDVVSFYNFRFGLSRFSGRWNSSAESTGSGWHK